MADSKSEQHLEFFQANPSILVQDTLWAQIVQLREIALANNVPTNDGMVFFDALAWTLARLIASAALPVNRDLMLEEVHQKLDDMVLTSVMRLAEVERGTLDASKLN